MLGGTDEPGAAAPGSYHAEGMSSMLFYGGLVLAIVFVVSVSVWAWVVISGSARADRESQRKKQQQDEQIARAREDLTRRYK